MDTQMVAVFDPGEVTGFATARVNGDERPEVLETGELIFPTSNFKQALRFAQERCDIVIIEDFIVRRDFTGSRLRTVRVIGALELIIKQDKIVWQQPAEKQRVPDKELEKKNLWSSSPHIRDALRHLLIWQQKRRP